MGKRFDTVTDELAGWLARQKLFFVATAPLATDGLINCSPKGLDTFRVLGPAEAGYLDLTGSGIETVAHVRENGRITLMFCGFEGPPRIVRLQGLAEVVVPGGPMWEELRPAFPAHPGARSIIRIRLTRISDSCGFGVPRMSYEEDRSNLSDSAERKGPAGLAEYRALKNAVSLDGLPGLPAESSAT
jgi:hypothetical protein